jgi:DNA recombination-mediator protein A
VNGAVRNHNDLPARLLREFGSPDGVFHASSHIWKAATCRPPDRMGCYLASRGPAIVSGLACGVDAIAHQGATSVGVRAIGVLGTGIDVCYPKENKKL